MASDGSVYYDRPYDSTILMIVLCIVNNFTINDLETVDAKNEDDFPNLNCAEVHSKDFVNFYVVLRHLDFNCNNSVHMDVPIVDVNTVFITAHMNYAPDRLATNKVLGNPILIEEDDCNVLANMVNFDVVCNFIVGFVTVVQNFQN